MIQVIPGEVLHSLNPRPSPLHSRGVQAASVLPVIGLAPRREDGMVASVEETESSASSTSSGRHSAGLPIVGPPRGLLATGLAGGKSFSGFLLCCHFYFIFSLLAYCRFFGLPFSFSEGSRGRDRLVVLPSLCLLVLLVLVSWCMCRSGLYLY